MKGKLVPLFVLAVTSLWAQKEDYVWLFGGNLPPDSLYATTALDFNVTPPSVVLKYVFVGFGAASTSIASSDGELLCYSNGVHIYNGYDEIIENGDNIHPSTSFPIGFTSIQGAVLIPFPGHSEQYYLFSCDQVAFEYDEVLSPGCSPVTFTLIDLNENGGHGKVIEKNETLTYDTLQYGMFTSVLHANGRDWWVIGAPTYGSNRFYKFLLSPEGMILHDEQEVGEVGHPGLGQGVISPDGKWIAYYHWFGDIGISTSIGIDLYSFDRCSGELSNHLRMVHPDLGKLGGVAFSPASRYMYASVSDSLYQYDLEAEDILESRQTVAVYDGFVDGQGRPTRFFLMKLGPDGRIYITNSSGARYMGVIENPDSPGVTCKVKQHSLELPTSAHWAIPTHPVFRLGKIEGSPCDTIAITAARLETTPAMRFTVSPNPASGAVQLRYELPPGRESTWQLFDLYGRQVVELSLERDSQGKEVLLAGLPAGLYVYRVMMDGGVVAAGKVVVE